MISTVSARPGMGMPFDQSPSAPLVGLLVADNSFEAEQIATSLAECTTNDDAANVQIVRVPSIAAARTHLRRYPVDVVLLDVALADFPSPRALYRLRVTSPNVPLVLLADFMDPSLAREALRAGAQDYLLKPLPDGNTLARALRFAIERHGLLSELEASVQISAMVARRWKLLADAASALSETSGTAGISENRFRALARVLVPDAADCFVLVVGDKVGTPGIVEVAHVNENKAGRLRAQLGSLIERRLGHMLHPPENGPASDLHARDAIRNGLATLGMESATIAAVHSGAHQRGFLALSAAKGRSDTVTDDDFVNCVGDRIAAAMDEDHLMRELQRAVAARDRAVSIVSHDLRSPLSTIQICATALLDPAPAPTAGVRQMADLIHRCTVWMQGIVQDLLDRTALDSGQVALHRQATSVNEIVTTAQVMFAPLAEEQSIDFVVESEKGVPDIDADPHRLLQVLSNLISNAMKVTPKGGRVAVGAHAAATEPALPRKGLGNAVRFTVSDNGPGIPTEDLAHVFDWFWQSPKGGSENARGGKGLGLAIAKGLVEAHHARLNVESKVGQGSTFWFSIPVVERGAEHMMQSKGGALV